MVGLTGGIGSGKSTVAAMLASRGAVVVDADQIAVTTGSQQGIDLLARTLLDPGDTVIVERPSYLAALQTFALDEARFETIDGDEQGARIDQLEAALARAKAAGARTSTSISMARPSS